jgi:hypothetical protein
MTKTIRRSIALRQAQSGITILTELPRRRFDVHSGEWYAEVVLMSGIHYRANRRQVCLLDSGNRQTIKGVVGSVRELRVEGDALIGTLRWARDAASQIVRAKYQAGDLERFTLAFEPLEAKSLGSGQTIRTRSGIVTGPARIVTRWSPLDCSIGLRDE